MTIRTKYVLIGVGILLLSAAATAAWAQEYTAEDYYRQAIDYLNQKNEEKAKEVFNKGVELDMKLATVDDILKSSYAKGMKQVKYDAATGKDNFDELVYKSGKPTVVLFYATNPDEDSKEVYKREAIVFKALSEMYGSKINFVVYNDRIAPKKQGLAPNGEWNISERSINENMEELPSMAIYSRFDLSKGETPVINDGRIKQIDILMGGPIKDEQLFNWTKEFPVWWINPNLYQQKTPDGNLYRFLGTADYKRIEGFKF